MFGLTIPAEAQPWVAMAILAVMFVLFVLERTPVEVTAIGGAAAMLVPGILPVREATGPGGPRIMHHRSDVGPLIRSDGRLR